MLVSRALSLATVVMALVGWGFAGRVAAQENLDAGKSPSQIFGGTCAACHKSPRGLLRTVPPGSLTGFLRQHYTTSHEMAGVLASYLIANGASEGRRASGMQPRGAAAVRPAPAPAAPGIFGAPGSYPGELPRPAAGQATRQYGPDGRRLSARQQRGKPAPAQAAEPANGGSRDDGSSKADTKSEGKTPSSETAKGEAGSPESGKPADDASPAAPAAPASAAAAAPPASDGGAAQSPAPEPASAPAAATARPADAPGEARESPEPPSSR